MRTLCWGDSRWSVRKILNHINQLPADSAFFRSLNGEKASWNYESELLATLIDVVRWHNFYFLKVNGADPKEPEPLLRPGEKREPDLVSIAELINFLE